MPGWRQAGYPTHAGREPGGVPLGKLLPARWEHIAGNQECLSHLLRDYEDCAESYPGTIIWPVQAQRALRGLIHAWHAAREQGLDAIPADARSRWSTSSGTPFWSASRACLTSPARRKARTRSPVTPAETCATHHHVCMG